MKYNGAYLYCMLSLYNPGGKRNMIAKRNADLYAKRFSFMFHEY